MSKKVLIIGGVAGGASTAARLRRVDESAEIILFEKGEYISFANCGLPYYIGGVIEQRDALLVQTPEDFNARFDVDVRVQNEVLTVDTEKKVVTVKNHATGATYEEAYDQLVLSPGSQPLRPPIPGIDQGNIFTLWTIPDTDRIKSFVDEKKPKKAVVIGGGFIGIEMAENLADLGIEVSLVEMLDQVMAPIDFEMAQEVHQHMRTHGVNLHLGDGVKEFVTKGETTTVVLQSGTKIESDMVMLSIGVRPQTAFLKESGVALNQRGGIIVDEFLRTNAEGVYAIGDAAEIIDYVNGGKTMIPLAGPANKQGRICANNMTYGDKEVYKGTQGTSIAKVFDLTVASTGVNEKMLKKNGKVDGEDYLVSMTHSKSNAGYYPGAIPMTMKVIFTKPEGKILGAQVVGYEGVDKRLDVIATAMRFGGTVYDLKELELAYAPPYSSAKDPVNMAGFVGENMLEGTVETVNWDQMDALDENTVILDIREPLERDLGYIEGSINIPVDELRDRFDELDRSKTYVVYCAIGVRGYVATRILVQNGFKAKNLAGGYATYSCVFCQDDGSKCGGVTCSPDLDYSESGDVEEHETADFTGATGEVVKLNACGLQCPGPIMQVSQRVKEMNIGDVLEVRATDPGFVRDIDTWCKRTDNTLLEAGKKDREFVARLVKGAKKPAPVKGAQMAPAKMNKTMVVFSGDLDKAIASLIIANGAASMGRQVTMFYTFWGLNILRRPEKVNVKKSAIQKAFAAMMPRGTQKLGLSRMNFMGMGAKLIRKIMKDHNVDQVETLLQMALDNGVKMIACNMSMDLMGITEEELIDGIELGGVASYLGDAEESDVNLFI